MTRQMHVSLFLLLLLFLFVQLCSTSGILAEEQSTGVVLEVPQEGQGASRAYSIVTTNRTFIRINTSTEDLIKDKYCSKMWGSFEKMGGEDIECQGQLFLSEEMKKTFLDTILPAAIKLHADRLLVDPVEGPLKVPDFEEGSVCKNFTVPDGHRKEGVENADMVLYVAARPENAFGVPCAYDNNSGRPVAGAINVQIYPLKMQRYNVRRVAHEIAHALGFDYKVFEKNNMVAEIEFGKRMRRVVNSSKAKEVAQKYYNCNELKGLELGYVSLEDHILNLSHLAWRNTNDDLMSSMYLYGAMHYSALTMSVFDGLPFYTVNWGMEESMTKGNQSGCKLFESECKDEGATKYPGRFCNTNEDKVGYSCTSDRLGYGVCNPVPDDRYPDKDKTCNAALYAQSYEEGKDHMFLLCSETTMLNLPGSIFGNNDSLCLDTEEYSIDKESEEDGMVFTGICARVSCDDGNVRVMYNGSSEWQNCSEEGEIIEVNRSGLNNKIKIKCPKYSEVCTVLHDGSSLLPLIEPKPLPAPAITTTTTTGNNESHQEQGETVGTERGHTNNNSSSVPSQSAERTQNTTGVNVSTNDNVTVPPTTEGNINKDNLTSPQVKEELKIRMGMDGIPAAACVLHALFLLMAAAAAAALAAPL